MICDILKERKLTILFYFIIYLADYIILHYII
jgi:hypothetical protein